MANQTKYLKLNKPQIGTTGWGNAINNNFETLDTSYGTLRANMSSIESRFAENSVYKFWYKGVTIDGVEAKEHDYIYILLNDGEDKDITINDKVTKIKVYKSFDICYATGEKTEKIDDNFPENELNYPLFSVPPAQDKEGTTGATNNFHYLFTTDTTADGQGLNQLDNFTAFYILGTSDNQKNYNTTSSFYIVPDWEVSSVYYIQCDDDRIIEVNIGDIIVMQRLVENNETKMRPTKLSQALGYVYGWSQDQMNTNKITAHKVPVPVAQNEVSLYVPTVINKSVQRTININATKTVKDEDTGIDIYTFDTEDTRHGEYSQITQKDGQLSIEKVPYEQKLANFEFYTSDGYRAILDYKIIYPAEGDKISHIKIQLNNPSGFIGICTYTLLHCDEIIESKEQ